MNCELLGCRLGSDPRSSEKISTELYLEKFQICIAFRVQNPAKYAHQYVYIYIYIHTYCRSVCIYIYISTCTSIIFTSLRIPSRIHRLCNLVLVLEGPLWDRGGRTGKEEWSRSEGSTRFLSGGISGDSWVSPTWRIIPVSKWLVSPIYKP